MGRVGVHQLASKVKRRSRSPPEARRVCAVAAEGSQEGSVGRAHVGHIRKVLDGEGKAGKGEAGPPATGCVTHQGVVHVGDVEAARGNVRRNEQVWGGGVVAQSLAVEVVTIQAQRGILGGPKGVDMCCQVILDRVVLLHAVFAEVKA